MIDSGLARDVHVWKTKISPNALEESRFFAMLDPCERQHASQFRFAHDRVAYVISHGSLRELLARYVDRAPEDLEFGAGEWGKPYLLDPSGRRASIAFNLSHSGDYALVAVSRDRAVGVDVELWSEEGDLSEMTERCFSRAERNELSLLAPKHRQEGFYAGWTRKEAYIKALGIGLTARLDDFDVSLGSGRSTLLLADRRNGANVSQWRLIDVPMEPGYSAALCAEGFGWLSEPYALPVRECSSGRGLKFGQ